MIRSECLTCTFRARCCSARLSRAQERHLSGTGMDDIIGYPFYLFIYVFVFVYCRLFVLKVCLCCVGVRGGFCLRRSFYDL